MSSEDALRKAAAVAAGEARGMSTDEWLTALRELSPSVCLEFAPADSLQRAYLYYDAEEDSYRVENVPATPDEWDEEALRESEAGALLDRGALIKPVSEEDVNV